MIAFIFFDGRVTVDIVFLPFIVVEGAILYFVAKGGPSRFFSFLPDNLLFPFLLQVLEELFDLVESNLQGGVLFLMSIIDVLHLM